MAQVIEQLRDYADRAATHAHTKRYTAEDEYEYWRLKGFEEAMNTIAYIIRKGIPCDSQQ